MLACAKWTSEWVHVSKSIYNIYTHDRASQLAYRVTATPPQTSYDKYLNHLNTIWTRWAKSTQWCECEVVQMLVFKVRGDSRASASMAVDSVEASWSTRICQARQRAKTQQGEKQRVGKEDFAAPLRGQNLSCCVTVWFIYKDSPQGLMLWCKIEGFKSSRRMQT